jgi:hypothetical protein
MNTLLIVVKATVPIVIVFEIVFKMKLLIVLSTYIANKPAFVVPGIKVVPIADN